MIPSTEKDIKKIAQSAAAGFEDRCGCVLKALKGRPIELRPIDPPYEPGRPRLPRGYSYSVMNNAMRVFLLRESALYGEANAILRENALLYIDDKVLRDDRDSFYWSIDILCRIIEFFGSSGSREKGLMDRETEELCCRMMYLWARDNSRIEWAEYEKSRTWHVWESENHHIQRFSAAWHITSLLARREEYKSEPLGDGATCAEHFGAWTSYAKEYLRERAKKSLFIETGNGFYGLHTLKGIYDFYDFAPDVELRRLAGDLLTLYWATWAEEQLGGVRGGGKARIYPGSNSLEGGDAMRRLAWYYLGVGEMLLPEENEFSVITSEYRLPEIVAEIALDERGRGDYEIFQRPLGLAADGCWRNEPDYHAETDFGGILRYSFCTPEFILGSLMTESRPLEDWMLISSQNRWQGAVFAGDPDCRIVLQCKTADMDDPAIQVKRAYNQHWSLQRRGTLITMKSRFSDGAAGMGAYFSDAGLTAPVEMGGWLFTTSHGAYAAVRIARGGWRLERDGACSGIWAWCEDGSSPVILEVARKTYYNGLSGFQSAVLSRGVDISGDELCYTSLSGDVFRMDVKSQRCGTINGEAEPRRLPMAYDSPFVRGAWDGGEVVIAKGGERLVLTFDQ